jgi:hypothetical protein
MSETDIVQLQQRESYEARQSSGIKRVLMTFGLALVWGFLSALVIGTLAAAIWTAIPTELLRWGAIKVNLIGYVSHCPFVPISSLVLLGSTIVGSVLIWKLKLGRSIGSVVFMITAGGLMIGLLGGVDITMFMGMGAGVGVGIVIGFIVGVQQRHSDLGERK